MQHATELRQDPYQGAFHAHVHEDWFRHQNEYIMSRSECYHCGGSIPESDEFRWKYAAAGGCLEGPFCSPGCRWEWLNE